MIRRIVVYLLATALLPIISLTEAQQPKKVARIGFLSLRPSGPNRNREAFRQGLRDLGYVEGQNIVVEYQQAGDKADRLPALAADLVGRQVDVIVAGGSQAVRAAQQATKSIPIVMTSSSDPVGTGFVASLARPGGNITGLSLLSPDLSGKRLELLTEIVAGVSRVAVLWNPDDPPAALSLKETQAAARALGIKLQSVEVRGSNDFDSAFTSTIKGHAEAVIILTAPIMNIHAGRIAEFAVKSRLPAISYADEFPDAGGLMSYGANLSDSYRRAATYVDKILKGAKPANLPVEQPTKFEFVINLKTAKQIDLAIPQSVLYRADRVIK